MAKFLLIIYLFSIIITLSTCKHAYRRQYHTEANDEVFRRNDSYTPSNCGLHYQLANVDTKDRLAGGYTLKAGQFPSYVRLKIFTDDKYMICGGTILSPNLILTAAQCVVTVGEDGDFLEYQDIYVKTGSILKDHKYDAKSLKVCYLNSYNGIYPYLDDIAIVRLDKNLPFDYYQNHACLPRDAIGRLEKLLAIGMGIDETNKLTKELRYLPAVLNSCPENETTYADTICLSEVIPKGIGAAVCRGDVGGPIIAERDGRHQVVGVISNGYGCDATVDNNPIRGSNVYKLSRAVITLMKQCAHDK